MPITKLQFKPGIHREGTSYAEEGNWYDCDKVRFRFGRPEKIGGWIKASTAFFKGVARVLMNWTLLDAKDCLAIGTNKKMYIEYNGVFYDITPVRYTDVKLNPITTGAAAATVHTYVTNAAHGAIAGDFVTLSGCAIIDGIPAAQFNKEHEIIAVLSTTSFTFSTTTGASAGAVTGGGTTTAAFQLSLGHSINILGGGWGTGKWSRSTWSSPLLSSISGISMRLWTVDNYGEDLVFATRDGPLCYWDATNGFATRGIFVSSMGGASAVPAQNSVILVTDERHVVSIGTTNRVTTIFDPLLIRWSATEDVANWTPAVTNTAGSMRIPLGSYVVAAKQVRQEILIWTDRSLHSLQFVGPPYVFGLQTLAENIDIAGPNAVVNVSSITYWMGTNSFWSYSGRAQILPCDVQRYVYDDLNFDQLPQIYASANDSFSEVTWLYCSASASQNDRYVSYNYRDGIWTYGTLGRSAMAMCPGRNGNPYATTGGLSADDGTLYIHEIGQDDGSTNPPTAISAYIESADFSITDGNNLMFVDRIIPDITFAKSTSASPSVTLSVGAKKFPGQAIQNTDSRAVAKEATVDQYTNQVWIRLRGRQMRFRVSSAGVGVSWLLGDTRINIRPDGKQ